MDKFRYELITAKKKIIEIKASSVTNKEVYHIGMGTYPIEFVGGSITGSTWRRIPKGNLFIIYKHTNKLGIKSADDIIRNINATTDEHDSEINKILQVINFLKEQKEIPEEYRRYNFMTRQETYQAFNVIDLLSTDLSRFNRGRGEGEKLYINYDYEASIMYQVACEYEKRSGYEVTVIGGAVMDTICNLVPREINLYISKPYDYVSTPISTHEPKEGGYNKTIKELTVKELFTYEDDYTYYNNFEMNTVAKGYLKTEPVMINIYIGQESANEFVNAVTSMDIGLITFTVKDGVHVPNQDIEKALENRTISYHSKKFEQNGLSGGMFEYYADPTEERLQRIYDAVIRYGFKLNPIKVRLQDVFKHLPFGEFEFVELGDSTKGMGAILAIEVSEYKKNVLEAMSFLLIDLGYEFYELKKMRLTLFDHKHGFKVTAGNENMIQVAHTYEGCKIQDAQIEEVRKVIGG